VKQKDVEEAEKQKNKEEVEVKNELARKLFGGSLKNASLMMQTSKRMKAEEAKKENTKDYFALEKICLNFDLFPEE
jgi:hypothetical protein